MTQSKRKKILFGFTAFAAVMAMASVASACIVQKGKLTVSVTETGSGRADGDTVIGAGTSHGWCQKAVTSAAADVGDTITYAVAPTLAGDCSGAQSLANGTYEVRVYNPGSSYPYTFDGTDWEFTAGTGCYATTPRRGEVQGTFTMSGGSGSLVNDTLALTSPNYNGASDASLVCVAPSGGNTSGAPGIFSPLRVINI